MEIDKVDFNESFKLENHIQKTTKKLLTEKFYPTHRISNIICGRAGTHSCFRERASVIGSKEINSNKKLKDQNYSHSILYCKKSCRNKTLLKAIIYTFIILANSLIVNNFKKYKNPNVLVFSVPNKYQQSAELKDFLFEKRIKNHFQNRNIQILVQKRFKFWNRTQEGMKNTMYIPLYLMRNHLKLACRSKMQVLMIKNLIGLIKIKQCDPLLLCYKEIIFESTLYENIELDRKIDVVYTQSNLRTISPISYVKSKNYKIRNIMIWYSTNSDLMYKKNIKTFKIQNNYLSLDRIDRHLVWDKYAEKTLAKMTSKPIFVSGSLLFYPKNFTNKSTKEEFFKVLLFDVTPNEGMTEEDFLNTNQAIQTIREIINSVTRFNANSNRELKLFIKPKRRYSKSHSSEYMNYISTLRRQNLLKLIHHSSNLYEIINDSHLVICFPWTSPAVIAKELRVQAVYYVSDKEYVWNLIERRDIVLLRREIDLYYFIKKNLVA
jgi:polysaccharide biosynthesis PFTS motif protein